MIINATLLRLDAAPPPEPEGPAVSVRCALTPLTAEQGRVSRDAGWDATAVVYVPMSRVPSPGPVENGQALVESDGGAPTLYHIAQVLVRPGQTLGHVQLYLAPK